MAAGRSPVRATFSPPCSKNPRDQSHARPEAVIYLQACPDKYSEDLHAWPLEVLPFWEEAPEELALETGRETEVLPFWEEAPEEQEEGGEVSIPNNSSSTPALRHTPALHVEAAALEQMAESMVDTVAPMRDWMAKGKGKTKSGGTGRGGGSAPY